MEFWDGDYLQFLHESWRTCSPTADFWRWVPHPEVWVLVVGLVVLYVYAARVIGPKVVPAGHAGGHPRAVALVRAGHRAAVGGGRLAGARHRRAVPLLRAHGAAHPAHPRGAAGDAARHARVARPPRRRARAGRRASCTGWPARSPPASRFNALALLSHWQVIVNGASSNGLFHYGMHTALVTTAVLFWIPVCGPFPELRISPPAQMVYLFVASIVPTVPGAWLTFADGAVYSVYDIPDRLWGLTVTSDQQIAGLLMKLGAGSYLWLLITIIFFQWAERTRSTHAATPHARSPTTRCSASSRRTRRPAPRS